MKFLEVTEADGSPVLLNIEQIALLVLLPNAAYVVSLANGRNLSVTAESFDKLKEVLRGYPAN